MNVEDLLPTTEAAAYCELSYECFRSYVKRGLVKPDRTISGPSSKAHVAFFSRETLDRFKAVPRRPRGRPKGPAVSEAGSESACS